MVTDSGSVLVSSQGLPSSWKLVRLADVAKTSSGGTPSRGRADFYGGPIPWVKSGELRDRIICETEESLSKEGLAESSAKLFPKGTVCIALYGATVGRLGILGIDAATNQAVCGIFPGPAVEPRYLYRFLESRRRHLIEQGKGGAQSNISQAIVREILIPFPPIVEQQRIVAEIEKQFTRLDSAVVALKRLELSLKRYRSSILKAAFEGRLVPTEAALAKLQERSYESGAQLLERILDDRRLSWQGRGTYKEPMSVDPNEQVVLPFGWVLATIDQLAYVVRGASPRPAGDPKYFGGQVPWITVGPLTADKSPYLRSVKETLSHAGRERSRYIEPQTLLLTNSGATLGVPKITLVGGCINDGVAALLGVEYPTKLYLLYYLRTQTEPLRRVNQGAAQPNLNTAIIKAIKVPLPPREEQTRIAEEVERRLSVTEELEALVSLNIRRAKNLRQSILESAFSGNL